MDTVLITGGLGYLGQRLTVALSAGRGWRVRALTRRSVTGGARETLVGCEIRRFHTSWDEAGGGLLEGVRHVVHLGGPDEKQCAADPVGMAHEACAFTHGLVKQAARSGIESIIMASTIHVYGAALRDDVTEATLPRPVHPYGIIKRLCEDLVMAGSLSGGSRSVTLRLANGLGAPVSPDITRWSLLVNDLCRQAVEKRRMVVHSDPRVLRNFVTIADICGAITHFLNRGAGSEPVELFHVGSSRAYSLGEMAELVQVRCAATLGFTPELVLGARSEQVIPPLRYHGERLAATGFVPEENFAAELDATLVACARWFAA